MSLPGILSTARGLAHIWLTPTLRFMSKLAQASGSGVCRDINFPDEIYTNVPGGSTGSFAISRPKHKMPKCAVADVTMWCPDDIGRDS